MLYVAKRRGKKKIKGITKRKERIPRTKKKTWKERKKERKEEKKKAFFIRRLLGLR